MTGPGADFYWRFLVVLLNLAILAQAGVGWEGKGEIGEGDTVTTVEVASGVLQSEATVQTNDANRMFVSSSVNALEYATGGNSSAPDGDEAAVRSYAFLSPKTKVADASAEAPITPYISPVPIFGSLRNKIAIAEMHTSDGKLLASVTFDWCHNGEDSTMEPSVMVHPSLDSLCPMQWGRKKLEGASKYSKCAYQISQGVIDTAEDGETCASTSSAQEWQVWDPLKARGKVSASSSSLDYILQEMNGDPQDKCDSTHYRNKTASCPAGALSRTHGTYNLYYDNLLGRHPKFIGRTLLQVGATADGNELSCSPIRFSQNCAYVGAFEETPPSPHFAYFFCANLSSCASTVPSRILLP
jgi:hypothetical protein